MFKILIAVLLTGMSAFADVPNPDFQYAFDHLEGVPAAGAYQLGAKLREAHNTAVCIYDFATQGGALGTNYLLSTDLKTPCRLPGKAIIRNGFVDVVTAPTSGGSAVIAFSSGSGGSDLKVLTAKGSYVKDTQYAFTPVFATPGTYIKLPTANAISGGVSVNRYRPYISIEAATLTAGKFRVFLDYTVSE